MHVSCHLEGCTPPWSLPVHSPWLDPQWLPFLACLEAAYPNLDQVAEACATKAGLTWSVLQTCANGPEGIAIQAENEKLTNALNPPHQYVPWCVRADLASLRCSSVAAVDGVVVDALVAIAALSFFAPSVRVP